MNKQTGTMSIKNFIFVLALMLLSASSYAQLRPTVPPGANFDLSAWKLQTLGDNRAFIEIKPGQLQAGHTSWYFYTDTTDGSMVFRTPVNGKTTASTVHQRVELRQVSGGSNWLLADTTEHRLDAICRVITLAPDTPKMVIGQIHGGDAKSQVLKLIWAGKKQGKCTITANFKNNDEAKKDLYVKLATGLSPCDTIAYSITMSHGKITVNVNGTSTSQTYTSEYFGDKDKYYFKAGNYLQCSGTDPDVFGLIKFYKLLLTPLQR